MRLNKIAAILAFIIGGMAVFAGGQVVLLGKVMDYYVIDWLPVYNLTLGLLTVFISATLLWRDAAIAPKVALATLLSHSAVMVILQTVHRDVVAPDSTRAMAIRIATWGIITALMIAHKRKNTPH